MDVKDKIIVVTGAASGIGRAMANEFHAAGAKLVVCSDMNLDGAQETANGIGGVAVRTDVSVEADIESLINMVEDDHGPIDLFCSNAGIFVIGGAEASNEDWDKIWKVNVMAHIWASRHLIPRMLKRGGGYFLNTASAAGLLSQIGSMPYAVTKRAAVAHAEWIKITYGTRGIGVSALCPQAVRSAMTDGAEGSVAFADGLLEADVVARACIETMKAEEFLVLPHAEVREYIKHKGADYDRWIKGMQRLNDTFEH